MDNEDNFTWRNESAGQNHYDWSAGQGSVGYPSGEGQPLNEVQPGAPKKNSAVVPILIALICLLSVVVVVGALVIFLQRENDDSMDEAAVGASTSSQSSAPENAVNSQAAKTSSSNGAAQVRNRAAGNEVDTCAVLKSNFEQKYDEEMKDKNDSLLPWDHYVNYCDGQWGQIVTAEWGVGDAQYWDGDKWIEISGRTIEDDNGPGLFCFDKKL